MKFRMGGSGGEGAGAGWIGNHYFAHKDEIYETDDSVMIGLLKKSKMAILIHELDNNELEIIQEPVKDEPKTKRR